MKKIAGFGWSKVCTLGMSCLARYTTVKDKLYFGDGKHRFYLERCCGNECEGTICSKCQVKNQVKVQDCRTFDHGIISGPYPANSQLYDSPYYHAAVAKYGLPNDADLERAREAQRMARGGTKPVSDPTPVSKITVAETFVAKAPKVKKEPSEPKPKAKRQPKQVITPVLQAPVEETKPVVKIPDAPMESMDDPLPVTGVIKVTLKPFKVGAAIYWRDSEREKLYKKEGTKRGAYVGRWDYQNQSIVRDAPDSDAD